MRFREFIGDLHELFDRTHVMANSASGYWYPPLSNNGSYSHSYMFNLTSDPVKDCNGPCYFLSVTKNGNIEFGHASDKDYSNRTAVNKEIERTTGINPSKEMMNTVLKALGEYVTSKNPEVLKWHPVKKEGKDVKNVESRKKIYDMWANRFLGGNYVKIDDNTWWRKDLVNQGDRGSTTSQAVIDQIRADTERNNELVRQNNMLGGRRRLPRQMPRQDMLQ